MSTPRKNRTPVRSKNLEKLAQAVLTIAVVGLLTGGIMALISSSNTMANQISSYLLIASVAAIIIVAVAAAMNDQITNMALRLRRMFSAEARAQYRRDMHDARTMNLVTSSDTVHCHDVATAQAHRARTDIRDSIARDASVAQNNMFR